MASQHPRRTSNTAASAVTPASTPLPRSLTIRKGATFHSPPTTPSSDRPSIIPSLPRRSQTTLEDVIEAHKRRVALTLCEIDRSLSSMQIGSPAAPSLPDDSSPVPRGVLNHTVATRAISSRDSMTNTVIDTAATYTIGGRALRPRRVARPSSSHGSETTSNVMSTSDRPSMSTGATSVSDVKCGRSIVAASAITRSFASAEQTESLSRLSERASNRIHEHILRPLLSTAALQDFHPILRDCPRKIHDKEIVCLRDLEKTLIFMAPERSVSAKLYLEFCITSIRCIQATVEFLHEREQTRPYDRPYTNGYFVDLVDQVRNYAQQVQATREKDTGVEEHDEVDAKSTDQVKLYGGLTRNGRPAELVRVKKDGTAVSLATGRSIKMESIEADEMGGVVMKRSLSEQESGDESILRSMARRKRSASAQEMALKTCSEPGCNKEFKRSCDLTKHEKTHSRPWKCRDSHCKYHEYGWPTEKELERHVNDKHSAAPVLYKCLFHPCPYQSKRDSNCKQHMEKAHGWTYVRSKNNGKNRGSKSGGSIHLPTPQTMNHRTPDSDFAEQLTPVDGEPELDFNAYNSTGVFNNDIFRDHVEDPVYPADEMMLDLSGPYISPVASDSRYISPAMHDNQYLSPVVNENHDVSSTDTSPFLNDDSFFQSTVPGAFGGPGNDFPLFDDDIYNAHVHLPPTPEHAFPKGPAPMDMDWANSHYSAMNPIEQDVHLSTIGHGSHMLYTPPTATDDDGHLGSFAAADEQLIGYKLNLMDPTSQATLSNADCASMGVFSYHSNNNSSELSEVPSANLGFSQLNSQDFFAPFYNPVPHVGSDAFDFEM